MVLKHAIRFKHMVRHLVDFAKHERAEWRHPNAAFRPDLLARGFFSRRCRLYPFSQFKPAWFLSDWEMMFRLGNVNGHAPKSQFHNKLFYHLSLRERGFGDRIPNLIGLVSQFGFTPYSQYATMDAAFDAFPSLFLKPMEGNAGVGIFEMKRETRTRFSVPYIVETVVSGHPYSSGIFPGSLNTIRVLLMRDPESRRFFISQAVHRFGTKRSAPVDNFSRGGICSSVDLESGILSSAKWAMGRSESECYENHPDTGATIKGVTVPHWEDVKSLALEASEVFPDLLIIGWDLAITPTGVCLIEGNVGTPGLGLMQSHQPALLEPRARRFFCHHRVISTRRARRLEKGRT